MRWNYDLCGAEPIIRDMPLYDATSIQGGELVMLSAADPDTDTAGQGVAFISAYVAGATEAVDVLGVCQETITCTDIPHHGSVYGKVIINPFAVYIAEYSRSETPIAFTSSTTALTMTGSEEDDIDCGWILVITATTSGNDENLRFITAASSSGWTIYSALTGGDETAGTLIKILPVNHRLTQLTADGKDLASQIAAGADISLGIMENYLMSDTHCLQPLRYATHKAITLSNGRIFADVCMLDHVYNPNA